MRQKKLGVVFYHKNIRNLYDDKWIKKSIESIMNQTYGKIKIYEVNYGDEDYSVISHFFPDFKNLEFYRSDFSNHAEAMNFIIGKAFESGCDYVFNTNLDDFYCETRIEKQLVKLKEGYDIVSSDFSYVEEINGIDTITFNKNIKSNTDIKSNLERDHNVIAHPVVAYSKKFWKNNKYIPEEIPREDLNLWKRSFSSGFKFFILDDVLLYYRLHQNQVTGNNSSNSFSDTQSSPTIPQNNPDPSNYYPGDLRNKIYYD